MVRVRLVLLVLVAAAAPFLFPGTSPAHSNGSTPVPPFLSEGKTGGTAAAAGTGAAGAAATAALATLPAGFTDSIALSGLTNPTNVRFASDGRIFVAEKSGLLKVFDSLSDPTPSVVADFRTETHNYWDRGLLGLALDPNFPATPYIYLLYTYDAPPGQTAPVWNDGLSDAARTDHRRMPGAGQARAHPAERRHDGRQPERRSSRASGASSTRATRSATSSSARTGSCT